MKFLKYSLIMLLSLGLNALNCAEQNVMNDEIVSVGSNNDIESFGSNNDAESFNSNNSNEEVNALNNSNEEVNALVDIDPVRGEWDTDEEEEFSEAGIPRSHFNSARRNYNALTQQYLNAPDNQKANLYNDIQNLMREIQDMYDGAFNDVKLQREIGGFIRGETRYLQRLAEHNAQFIQNNPHLNLNDNLQI